MNFYNVRVISNFLLADVNTKHGMSFKTVFQ
jgi:hypothetical protein